MSGYFQIWRDAFRRVNKTRTFDSSVVWFARLHVLAVVWAVVALVGLAVSS